ncbi:MAG: NAD(P)-binding domain-containing protein [Pyrinomonadaceae bacterium]
MKRAQIIISVLLLALLIAVNQVWGANTAATQFGGLTWVGWTSIGVFLFAIGLVVTTTDFARTFGFLARKDSAKQSDPIRRLTPAELTELGLKKYRGPAYPHPVIFNDRCIGCQACVDACPHDVLAIVDGRAAVIAADQCMEDTACQVECPVSPKACIVINTTKKIRARPAPERDAASYLTNVPGCYIIGDVSGVPLIKNAVKEGREVIEHIAAELAQAAPEPQADVDVAIIGVGPGGASAALTAHEGGLRYVGIEQERILSTIAAYPKGKYIFFKPDTKDWQGGLSVTGLGLVKGKYDEAKVESTAFENALEAELNRFGAEQASLLRDELSLKIPAALRDEFAPHLEEKVVKEMKSAFKQFLGKKNSGNLSETEWRELFEKNFLALDGAEQRAIVETMGDRIADDLQHKIPGDQRERILAVWLGGLTEKGVVINENESCKSVKRAEDGDYFLIKTERGGEKTPITYRARRVVLAIGLRGSPNKLRLPNEEMKISLEGQPENKVIYSLSNPNDYKKRHIVIVGGGNSAVEAAVDLVARREGSTITARSPDEMNKVTLLVRSFLATNVKFGNKMQLYQCVDNKLLDVRFGVAIKEMRERELVLMDVESSKVIETIPNDYIFALIGGERPDRFLQSIGISIS